MLYSLRIGGHDHTKTEYIKRLIEALRECGGVFDEVWLATNYGFLSVEDHAECARGMKECAMAFDKAGIKPSLQISRTIGHAPEILLHYDASGIRSLNVPHTKFLNGKTFGGRFCWNNKDFIDYNRKFLTAYAENIGFEPAIIWVDDDVRIRAPYANGHALCFCESCLTAYEKECGKRYTFEEMQKEFLTDEDLRRDYTDFQMRGLSDFSKMISEAILSKTKEPIMALQSTVTTELGAESTRRIFDSMAEVSGKPVAVRAGCSFYNDHDPRLIIRKALGINYCLSRMKENVTIKNCEIENLPFVSYGKSVECPALEASLYMAYGCNMASVTLMNENEPLDFHKKIFEKLMLYKPYLLDFVKKTEGTRVGGLSIYRTKNAYFCDKDNLDAWDENGDADEEARVLARLGIPINAEPKGTAYILTPTAARTLTSEDVDFLLRSPVVTDAEALLTLYKMGYEEKIGISVKEFSSAGFTGVTEQPVAHPINEGVKYKGWIDSTYVNKKPIYTLCADGIEPVTVFKSPGADTDLGCPMGVVRMKSGARWLIKGGNLYNPMVSLDKRIQFTNAIDYIASAPLAAYTVSYGQVMVIPRVDKDERTVAVTLLNISISDVEDLKISVNMPRYESAYTVADPYGESEGGKLVKCADRFIASVSILRPWRTKTIYFCED